MLLMPRIQLSLKKYSYLALIIPCVAALILGILYVTSLVEMSSIHKALADEQYALSKTQKELHTLKSIDQVKKNNELQTTIASIEASYKDSVKVYETIQDLKAQKLTTDNYEKQLTLSLSYLSQRNYSSATATLTALHKQIETDRQKKASQSSPSLSSPLSQNAVANNNPPSNGYAVQKVSSDVGEFTVSIISADLGSTRVIVDTASESDCRDNCPVLPLSTYATRNGAFAAINGSYFCPASYPSCSGKTNSFDTLLMNKNKTYFNSDNNVYSNVPVAIFGSGFARFIGQSSGWGRDTSVDAVIANQPLLISGGNVVFGGDGDPKKGSKGPRSFIGNKGNIVYIGVVSNATVAEAAHVLKTLGLENALNLDSGGSTALWSGGYKAGPGRDIPNAVLFIRK